MTTNNATLVDAAARAFVTGFEAVIRIEPEGSAALIVEGRGETCTVRLANDDEKDAPTLIWRAAADTLQRVFEGGRALDAAYVSGRLRIAGDMSVMARLKLESGK
jgi:putative sterol carrier protein